MVMSQTFLCPYCYEVNSLSSVEYFCKKCNDTKPYTGKGLQDKLISQLCPICKTSSNIVCPSSGCKKRLPEGTLNGTNTIISIVGTRGSGKSHYVGVLINELYKRVAPNFGASFIGFNKSHQLWQEKFGNRLYSSVAQALEATPAGNQEDPLIYEMIFSSGRTNTMYTFVFFDTAGENFGDEEQMSVLNKYIYKSAGVICLLDPFQIPGIAERVDPEVAEGSSSGAIITSNSEVVSNVANLIRSYRGMSRSEKIKTPISVVFTKLDAISDLIPEGSVVLDPSPHSGSININDMHNVNKDMEAFLIHWDEKSFVVQVNNDFETSAFFAVSALGFGNHPDVANDRRVKEPRPHRVEDPFLWILNENRILDKKYLKSAENRAHSLLRRFSIEKFRSPVAVTLLLVVGMLVGIFGYSEAQYQIGMHQKREGNYSAAINNFQSAPFSWYRNPEERITYCELMIEYIAASDEYEAGNFYSAHRLFSALGTFNNSDIRATNCLQPWPSSGTVYSGCDELGHSSLTVLAEEDFPYRIVLTIRYEDGDVFAVAFLSPGEYVELRMPSGLYSIHLYAGVKWFGASDLFGGDTIRRYLASKQNEVSSLFYIDSQQKVKITIKSDLDDEGEITWGKQRVL